MHHASLSSTKTLPYLSPQTFSNFVVGSIVGQPAQDRNYTFTVALANDALSDGRCADAVTHQVFSTGEIQHFSVAVN
jgi:hypothetical protein